jgi:ketosteroid isomerase-like protein
VAAPTERFLRRLYDAFNARDIETAIAAMHPDVDWPNAMEGRREHGHDAVRAYWKRQFGVIDSRVEPERFTDDGNGRVTVDVHQVVRDLDGNLLLDGQVQHAYVIRGGLVERMDVREGSSLASSPSSRRSRP